MEPKKRPRRIPLTREEVANVIAYRRQRELVELRRMKKTLLYKALNTFNIICFFVYLEVLFCYFGPCTYQTHYSYNSLAKLGDVLNKHGKPIVAEIDVFCVHGSTYKFIIDDFIEIPPKMTSFVIGKDFLLRKDMKGRFFGDDTYYRIFSASPILFLSTFVSIISIFGFFYNLNENMYSLSGLTLLNAFTLLGILLI